MGSGDVKERPILFSGPMVKAILAGKKTQTRRLVKAPRGSEPSHAGVDFGCPYGQLFDRLWVRESWQCNHADQDRSKVNYRADGRDRLLWTPSIHMPRWASRITLEVTDVRVQRLQDISEEDAKAEGAEGREAFASLWDAINGNRASWASNPWTWAIGFRVLP